MSTNLVSRHVAVTTDFVAKAIGTDIAMKQVTGIQNTTGGVMTIKFNGGDGEFTLENNALYEPFQPFQGSVEIKSASAGNAVFLG